MLSHDLARLYGVESKVLVQAVKRNLERFPEDFNFPLDTHELNSLRSQFVTSSWGGLKKLSHSMKELHDRISQFENRYDRQFKSDFDAIREIITMPGQGNETFMRSVAVHGA
jgi:hypothetical protein